MVVNKGIAVLAGLAIALSTIACNEPEVERPAVSNPVNRGAAPVSNTNTAPVADREEEWDSDLTREEFERERAQYERRARQEGNEIGSGANDLWLWTKTRSALATTDDLRDSTIDVDVENDVVTLRGTVASAAQRTRAADVAKRIEGVKDVRNNLTVSEETALGGGDRATNGNTNARK